MSEFGTARRLRQRNGMSAIGGTAYVAAKLLARDEAWCIAREHREAAGAVDEALNPLAGAPAAAAGGSTLC